MMNLPDYYTLCYTGMEIPLASKESLDHILNSNGLTKCMHMKVEDPEKKLKK